MQVAFNEAGVSFAVAVLVAVTPFTHHWVKS